MNGLIVTTILTAGYKQAITASTRGKESLACAKH